MKIKHRSGEIPVDMIYPHPDNPRKDLGDLTELAESIKKDGIFQNLTVIQGGKGVEAAHPDIDDPDGYTVIIGHRRLAAAKLAGLDYVPCMVAQMTENEQVATMLLENMQRNDLTVYEQAQGFQMMLDLGETQATICEKTGLSKTTVRHRLKLLELDEEEFKKSQERQPTIADYIELEKISDPKLKNEALAKIGTNDFTWALKKAIDEEKRKEYRAAWLEFLSERAQMIKMDERSGRKYLGYYYIHTELSEKQKEEIEQKIKDEGEIFYAYDLSGSLYIVGAKSEKPAPASEPSEEEIREKTEKEKKFKKLNELENMAHDVRKEFVAKYDTVANDEEITAVFLTEVDLTDINYWTAAELLNIYDREDEYGPDELEDLQQEEKWKELADYRPATVMLALMYSYFDDSPYDYQLHDWQGKYRQNLKLEKWYDILKTAGYKMSRVEKKLLDGTHEVFGESEET
jgi:ParB family chromosome partitioning protein